MFQFKKCNFHVMVYYKANNSYCNTIPPPPQLKYQFHLLPLRNAMCFIINHRQKAFLVDGSTQHFLPLLWLNCLGWWQQYWIDSLFDSWKINHICLKTIYSGWHNIAILFPHTCIVEYSAYLPSTSLSDIFIRSLITPHVIPISWRWCLWSSIKLTRGDMTSTTWSLPGSI